MTSVMNNLLSINIPTYNRPEIVSSNLEVMIPKLRKWNICIHISDDSDDNRTFDLIEKIKKNYEYIFYKKNNPSLGHDQNFFATVMMGESKYVWYLADSRFFEEDSLDIILDVLEKHNPDYCFINSRKGDNDNIYIEPVDSKEFMIKKAWYLTLSGATIYKREQIKEAEPTSPLQYFKNFPQLWTILNSLRGGGFSIYWIGERILKFNRSNKKSYWLNKAIDVFCKDWIMTINSFSDVFTYEERTRIIQSHDKNNNLFRTTGLLKLRSSGGLTHELLRKYKSEFSLACPNRIFLASIISLIPVSFAYFLNSIIERVHYVSNKLRTH